jgi:hypothetical protein
MAPQQDNTIADMDRTMSDYDGTISDFGSSKPFFLIQSSNNFLLPRKSHTLPLTRKFTLGRSRNNDLVLDNQHISSSHAKLSWSKNQWLLTDNGSTNGTFVNGERIQEQFLLPNDVITFGTCPLRLKLSDKPPPSLKPLVLLMAGFVLGIGSFYFLYNSGQEPASKNASSPEVYQVTPPDQPRKTQQPAPATPATEPAIIITPSAVDKAASQSRSDSYYPVPILNFKEILYNRINETTLYRYSLNPVIYILDFPSLYIQGRSMNRIMALIEDYRAPKDRVLSEFEFE